MIVLFIDSDVSRHDMVEEYLNKNYSVLHAYSLKDVVETLKSCKEPIYVAMVGSKLEDGVNASEVVHILCQDKYKTPTKIILHGQDQLKAGFVAELAKSPYRNYQPFSKDLLNKVKSYIN